MNNIVSDKVKNFYTNKLEYLRIYIDCKILFLRFFRTNGRVLSIENKLLLLFLALIESFVTGRT